jgi:hypothetical protein
VYNIFIEITTLNQSQAPLCPSLFTFWAPQKISKFSRKSIINHIIDSEKEFKKVSYTIQNNNFFILLSGYKLSKCILKFFVYIPSEMSEVPAKRRKLAPRELELLYLDDDALIEIFDKLDHNSKMQNWAWPRYFRGQ